MKGELYFGLRLEYLRTEYEPLMRLCIGKPTYDYDEKKYLWIFPHSRMKEVEAITGTIIIPGFKEPQSKESIPLPKWKGKDIVQIIEYPKVYQIIEHRKQEDGTAKELKHNVDRETVKKVWQVCLRLPQKPIKTPTVAEKICEAFNIDRFDRSTGSFQFDKFFGSRADYYKYFYLPMKVLVHKGLIKHHKKGMVERLPGKDLLTSTNYQI